VIEVSPLYLLETYFQVSHFRLIIQVPHKQRDEAQKYSSTQTLSYLRTSPAALTIQT